MVILFIAISLVGVSLVDGANVRRAGDCLNRANGVESRRMVGNAGSLELTNQFW
jgi:hypothetical protein